MPKLLSTNTKLEKSVPGFLIMGLQLAPSDQSGYNTCRHASVGCRMACLFTSGHGFRQTVKDGRIRKTVMFFEDRERFWNELISDLEAVVRKAKKLGLKPAVRLNTISDLPWEKIKTPAGISIFEMFGDIIFYDYTKYPDRALAYCAGKMPHNYHLTFSRSESNEADCERVIEAGGNVAVVFDKLPAKWYGRDVIDGDKHDARFLDRKGVVVGLVEKGDAKKDEEKFVIRID